jgi:hypothetical protein
MTKTIEIRNNAENLIGKISFDENSPNLSAVKTVSGFRLTLPAKVNLRNVKKPTPVPLISNIRGDLSAVEGNSFFEIGELTTDGARLRGYSSDDGRGDYDSDLYLQLRGSLSDLASYEKLRAGKAPQFRIYLRGEISYLFDVPNFPRPLRSAPEPLRLDSGHDIRISYSTELWIKNVLRRLGVAENVVVEIPLAASPPAPWDGVWQALLTARNAFEQGGTTGWNGCVLGVRLALERWRDIEDTVTVPTNPRDRSKQERINNLRLSLHQCTHAWVHGTADNCTRDDAVLMLATLSALLAERKP